MSDRYGSISINQEELAKKEEKPEFRKPVAHKNKKPKSRKSLFFVLFSVFLVASYFLSARYLAPMAIQKYLPGYIEKTTGITCSLGQVEVNPFNFQLTFSDITADVRKNAADKPLLQIPSFFVDMDLTSLLRNSFVCDKLTIEELELNIVRFKDSGYNLPVLSRLTETQNQEEIIDFTKLPFLFSFNNIDISNSKIVLSDQLTEKTHTVEEIHLAVPTLSNFSFQAKKYIEPYFSALINNSHVELSGKTIAMEDGTNFQTKLFCSINALDLVPYFSYLPAKFPLTLSKGFANLTLEVTFSPGEERSKLLTIDIKIDGSEIFLHAKKDDTKVSLPDVQFDATLNPVSKRLHIRSLVAKKPQLITKQKHLSRELANILSTGVTIDLLLFDQGRLVLSNKENFIWSSLQFSIKDFDTSKIAGSIHFSGEQATGPGSFSWQGKLVEAGTIKGKLLLNEFPADTIVRELYTSADLQVKGSTEFTGNLNLHTIHERSMGYSLDNATLQFLDLQIIEDEKQWLQADSMRLTRLGRKEQHFDLGNLFLKNASLRLTDTEYPPLFSELFTATNRPRIQGLDFSGEIHVKQNNDQEHSLHFSDVRIQANRLDKKATSENFIFNGKLGTGGLIKSHGKLNLSPTELQTNITFSDIDSAQLSPFFSQWPLLYTSHTMLNGKGVFSYPKTSFKGYLELNDGSLQIEKNVTLLSWDAAKLDKVDCTFYPFSLQTSTLEFHNPNLQFSLRAESPFLQMEKGLLQVVVNNTKPDALFPVRIKKISFQGATASLLDHRPSPTWKAEIGDLSGHINNLNSMEKGLTSFAMEGRMEGAPFTLSGSATLLQDKKNGRLQLNLTNFPLYSFNDQLADSPLNAEKASISLLSKLTETGSVISNITEINITGLLAKTTDSDTALALVLLKDTNDTFPLHVQMDDLDKSLFQESVNSFQTTVIKASYAPLLLDPEFSDLQENDFIPFQPGTNKISTAGKEILIRYSELLAKHPGIALSATGMADGTIDRDELSKAIPAGNPLTIQDDELLELAQERSLIIYDFCTHSLGIAPVRISINEKPLLQSESPAHGATLSIKALAQKNTAK